MTTIDLDRSDLTMLDEMRRIAPLFPETNRGVQQASSEDDGHDAEERSRAWRAVMAGHLL